MKILSGNRLFDADNKDSNYLNDYQRDYSRNKDLKRWEESMKNTDDKAPRFIEDIYDVLTSDQKDKISDTLKTAIISKKQLRSQKP